MNTNILLIFLCIFFSSTFSDDVSTTSDNPSTSSDSPTASTVSPCGAPNQTQEIVELSFNPNEIFYFNAPFDIQFMDYFRINHAFSQRVAYRIQLEMSKKSRILVPKKNGILEKEETKRKVVIGFSGFKFDEKKFRNDSITIEWVNVPEDALPGVNEECFKIWFAEDVTPKNHTLEIIYNP
ncbi:hypothetical protein GCK72_000842 [Caenorhabditis remanei]|uniref:MSP domain-containing protein n=1 Tax=Caenorhabditis remanei TaxID=31234 RepID=E3N4P1_CAERE|nr:hypothetical protein GCK72_000842 [Caenorhabditis remanei]EFO86418.1 hypothetical protein CRE_01224 [Caenorhabditis remanei]KAF1769029.1 hypothetical protein GCK72_000842 [Caenorhabditis remanei]